MNASTSDPREDPQWELVRAAARSVVPTPPGLIARVFRSVQGVRGRLSSSSLELSWDGDRLSITERALVLLTRRLGIEISQSIGGLHISAVAMDENELQVLVTVHYGIAAIEAAEALRTRLSEELVKQVGAETPPISVHIIDVHSR
jgi:hypothetical protein